MASENLREEFERELQNASVNTVLEKGYRRKKLILWLIRLVIAVCIYIYFWEHQWLRYTLVLYIPLSIFSISSILGWNFFLNKKIIKIRKKISEAENTIDQ